MRSHSSHENPCVTKDTVDVFRLLGEEMVLVVCRRHCHIMYARLRSDFTILVPLTAYQLLAQMSPCSAGGYAQVVIVRWCQQRF